MILTSDELLELAGKLLEGIISDKVLHDKELLDVSDLVRYKLYGKSCLMCTSRNISFHEIFFRSTHPHTWMQFANRVPLCIDHHTDAHNGRLSKADLVLRSGVLVRERYDIVELENLLCDELDAFFGF